MGIETPISFPDVSSPVVRPTEKKTRSFRDDWFVKGPQMVCGYCHGAVVQDKETKQWVHVRWRKDAFGWGAVLQNKRHGVTKAIAKPTDNVEERVEAATKPAVNADDLFATIARNNRRGY